jgi:two-component system, NarL family, nitrate/nitrite response regulator NarL
VGRSPAALPVLHPAGHDGRVSTHPPARDPGDSAPSAEALRVAVTVRDPRLRARLLHGLSLRQDVEVGPRHQAEVTIASPAFRGEHDLAAEVPAVYLGEWEGAAPAAGPGPCAFLSTGADIDQVVAAARAVAAGLTVLDPEFAVRLRARSGPERVEQPQAAVLTEREREVLALMAEGLPNKGIGRALGISEHTAKYHVAAILSKLDAQSRAEAVMLAARRGLVAL